MAILILEIYTFDANFSQLKASLCIDIWNNDSSQNYSYLMDASPITKW